MDYDHIVIYGYIVRENEFKQFDDKILPWMESNKEKECVLHYGEEIVNLGKAVFGKQLAFADKWNGFNLSVINPMEYDPLTIKKEYEEAFGYMPENNPYIIAHSIYR